MNPMRTIDAAVLDSLFQPVINHVLRHPADVALATAAGGSVLSSSP